MPAIHNLRTSLRDYNRTTGIYIKMHDLRVLIFLHYHDLQTEGDISRIVDYRRWRAHTKDFLLSLSLIKIDFKPGSSAKRFRLTEAGKTYLNRFDMMLLSATVEGPKYSRN